MDSSGDGPRSGSHSRLFSGLIVIGTVNIWCTKRIGPYRYCCAANLLYKCGNRTRTAPLHYYPNSLPVECKQSPFVTTSMHPQPRAPPSHKAQAATERQHIRVKLTHVVEVDDYYTSFTKLTHNVWLYIIPEEHDQKYCLHEAKWLHWDFDSQTSTQFQRMRMPMWEEWTMSMHIDSI